ncbi:uncharacterized protein LOC129002051 [Macrosteles quadrilineatus]|uniref:uncharacterized protein LOC129002051 n=1 Tax=Macrosteles quadrilineatus TaxID=74068 RepID=UPI0023E2DE17|nr:uncharacterized protein LOC129002051 [Macrosteles quadrilineatus]
MNVIFVVAISISSVSGLIDSYLPTRYEDVVCACGVGYNATLSAYFPVFDSDDIADYTDRAGTKLHSLQEFLDGRSPYVTASMDRGLNLPYGTALCIPELNRHYRRRINIEVRDTHADLDGFGTSKVVICVRSVADSYDLAVNRPVSLIIEK